MRPNLSVPGYRNMPPPAVAGAVPARQTAGSGPSTAMLTWFDYTHLMRTLSGGPDNAPMRRAVDALFWQCTAGGGIEVRTNSRTDIASYSGRLRHEGRDLAAAGRFETLEDSTVRMTTFALHDEQLRQLHICGEVMQRPEFTRAQLSIEQDDPVAGKIVEEAVEHIDGQLPRMLEVRAGAATFSLGFHSPTRGCDLVAEIHLDTNGDMTGLRVGAGPDDPPAGGYPFQAIEVGAVPGGRGAAAGTGMEYMLRQQVRSSSPPPAQAPDAFSAIAYGRVGTASAGTPGPVRHDSAASRFAPYVMHPRRLDGRAAGPSRAQSGYQASARARDAYGSNREYAPDQYAAGPALQAQTGAGQAQPASPARERGNEALREHDGVPQSDAVGAVNTVRQHVATTFDNKYSMQFAGIVAAGESSLAEAVSELCDRVEQGKADGNWQPLPYPGYTLGHFQLPGRAEDGTNRIVHVLRAVKDGEVVGLRPSGRDELTSELADMLRELTNR